MRIRISLLFSLVLLYLVSAFSTPSFAFADNSFERQLRDQPMDFKHYTTEQGLSHSNVFAMLQDKTGFMWFGTDDGLNKFDGYTFTVFKNDPKDPNSLSNNQIIAIEEGADGILWIATYRGGLNQFNPVTGKFSQFLYNPINPNDSNGLSHENINAMKMDKEGMLWIGTGGGLDKFDTASHTFTHIRFDEDGSASSQVNVINTIALDNKEAVWTGTADGLIRYDRKSSKFIKYQHNAQDTSGISDNILTSLTVDNNDDLWIGTQNAGLNRFDSESQKFIRYTSNPNDSKSLIDNKVNQVYSDNSGNIWIGTDKGLEQWNQSHGVFKHISNDIVNQQSLNGFNISSIYEDRQHDLWVATEKGLNVFSPKSFVKYQAEDAAHNKLLNNSVSSFYEAKDGLIWFGTNDGLQTFDRETGSFNHYLHDPQNQHSVSNGTILTILEDSQGTIWAGSKEGGLNRFNAPAGTFTRFNDVQHDRPDMKIFNTILKISEKNEQELWIATFNGLFVFDKNKGLFRKFTPQASKSEQSLFARSRFSSVISDASGNMWMGTLDSGIFQYETNANRLHHYPIYPNFSNNLSSNSVSMIHIDPEGTLWVGTKGGLEQFDPKTGGFERYTEKEGLPNNLIWAVTDDNSGNLWISTSNGISRFNPKDKTFHNYDQSNGLQSNAFISRSFLKTKDGDIFFGGNNGFNWIRPSVIRKNGFQPRVVINSFKVFDQLRTFDKPLSELNKIQLSYKENFFSFEFAALDYRNSSRIQYAYKLDGFDKDWVYSNNRRYASYMNLKGGHYVLHIKATNSDGVWNAIEKTVELEVISAWWHRWWAYAGYIVTFLLALIIYMRQRSKKQELKLKQQAMLLNQERVWNEQLRHLDQMKDEFLANTSHELRTPLNGMIGVAQTLVDGAAGRLTAAAQENLEVIISSGNRLAQLINDLLDFSMLKSNSIKLHSRSLDMKSLTDVVISLLLPLTRHKRVRLINSIESERYVYADENRVQQIMYNLVGNAIKFTEQGQIEIRSHQKGNFLEITVSDTGIGIKDKDIERIFDSFVQVDGSIQRSFEGTGLGLTITRELIELHDGSIRVKSQWGKGTDFIFTLPVSEGIQPEFPHEATIQASNLIFPQPVFETLDLVERTSLSEKVFILIIDDDPIYLKVLQNQLSLNGYLVEQAADGLQALKMLGDGYKPDLIVMDIMMPKMSGYELTGLIREQYTASELPILLLTAKSQSEDVQTGFEVGANDYLIKPVNKGELHARIKLHLQLAKWHQTMDKMVSERTRAIQSLLDNAGQGFLSFGPNLIVEKDYSLECVKFLSNDLEGRYIPALLYPNLPIEQEKLQQKLYAFFSETDQVRKNDSLEQLSCELLLNNFTVQLEFKQISHSDYPEDTKCMLVLTDRSKLRMLETQVEQADHIYTMEKLAVLGQLAAGIAHEIRNPLTVIDGFMQILVKGETHGDKHKSFIELMHTEVKRISELVSEFLMLAKPMPVQFKKENIYHVLKSTLEFMSSEASLHNIKINYDFAGKELFIEMDSKQMKQVFINVIKNAIEASFPGGLVQIKAVQTNEFIEITIDDKGKGIPQEQLRKIFDPFFTQKDTGTGLGLTTSLNIVRNHQGVIDVSSILDNGTSVIIKLPLSKQD
jgi:signal transduction histidine kinase/ligand-binding sensor domain-containing protein/FixJ family two-component response regulator